MRKHLLLFFLMCLTSIGTALGQNITVSGIVLDEIGQPVMGATVRLKNDSSKGTITDLDGQFKLETKEGELLLITFVGYKPQEVKATQNITVTLVPDNELLDEVMVVGYGTSTKRSFTGSAVTVNADAMEKKSISSVASALAGEVPGVNIVNTNGQPGKDADIYIRGVGSVNASKQPLYVVDGVPFDGLVSSINPSDIESTTLLKDAASTSIYGARGANGVILITTKAGKSGKMSVSGDFKFGMNTHTFIPRHSVITDPEEYLNMAWSSLHMTGKFDAPSTDGSYPDDPTEYANKFIFSNQGIAPEYNFYKEKDASKIFDKNGKVQPGLARLYTPERWIDEALQPSTRMESNIQISGGNEKLKGFASFGYLNDKGITKNSNFTRYTSRLNLDFNPKEWIQVKGNLSYVHSLSNESGQGSGASNIFGFLDGMPPIYPVYKRDAYGVRTLSPYYDNQYEYDFGNNRGFSPQSNGISNSVFDPDLTKNNEISYNGMAIIRFLDGFSFENTYSGMFLSQRVSVMENPFYGTRVSDNGSSRRMYLNAYSNTLLNLLRYSKSLEGGHSIEAFIAHEAHSYTDYFDNLTKTNLIDPNVDALSNAIEQKVPAQGYDDTNRMESYFAQVNYDYLSKYFLSATFRYDGSSRFSNNKWGPFGSVGAAWVMSDEDFLKGNEVLTFAKLKASWGTLGQQEGIGMYSGQDLYNVSMVGGEPVLSFYEKGNPDLTWERSNMLQIGAELQFANQLDLNIELYDKRTTDLIYSRRVAPSNGYSMYNTNDGMLQNYGADIDLTWRAIQHKDYYLTLRANAGFVGNKMLKMPIEPSTGEPKYLDETTAPYGRMEGKSLYDYYMRNFEGVNRTNGLSEWTLYYVDNDKVAGYNPDTDTAVTSMLQFQHDNPELADKIERGKTTNYDEATRFFVGKSALPVVRGGLTLSGGYKGIEASMQFVYGLGGYGYDYVYANLMGNTTIGHANWSTDMRNRWMKKGDVTDVPRLNNGVDKSINAMSTRFLTSSSFLNMSNFMVSYTLPASWTEKTLGVKNIKIWVSGDNLFLLSARKGYNPSTSLTGDTSTSSYNPLSTITGGLRVSF